MMYYLLISVLLLPSMFIVIYILRWIKIKWLILSLNKIKYDSSRKGFIILSQFSQSSEPMVQRLYGYNLSLINCSTPDGIFSVKIFKINYMRRTVILKIDRTQDTCKLINIAKDVAEFQGKSIVKLMLPLNYIAVSEDNIGSKYTVKLTRRASYSEVGTWIVPSRE